MAIVYYVTQTERQTTLKVFTDSRGPAKRNLNITQTFFQRKLSIKRHLTWVAKRPNAVGSTNVERCT